MISIRPEDDSYPVQFHDLKSPPKEIFAIGDVSLLATPMVSIVGTRDATGYGLRATRSIASELARAGVTIVSGMALGIDAEAHRTALEVGGKTIAVMGTGVDVPYPPKHRQLHRAVCENGLVISELGPGLSAHKGAFPKRNRIIAALGRCTIVVEAGFKSGAKITAENALEMTRKLAAVPGPIDSPQSDGTNLLIRDGALVITSPADALALAGVTAADQREPVTVDGNDARVWSALGGETLDIDRLAHRSGLGTRDCLTAVTSLELSGMVECLITGEVRRR